MDNSLFQDLLNKVSRKLTNVNWLNRWNIEKQWVENFIKDPSFISSFKDAVDEKDYSSRRVFFLCRDLINIISKETVGEDWLTYVYMYTLNKSFPEAVTIKLQSKYDSSCELYLKLLKVFCEFEKNSNDNTWQSKYPLNFLSSKEEQELELGEEYNRFLKAFKHDCIYEMMKLNQEILGFNTLDHVCGVHSLAIFIARQLKNLNIEIDLGRVSGAAAGHDIGKYGCKGAELKRVPYLHYYYSDQWFKKNKLTYIGNIAINHSTWDLELDNLSLESLILIYSDFRVKNKENGNNAEMYIFTLKESFQVILQKLDNVTEEKAKRYKKVYDKLKDFEDYLVNLGITVDIDTNPVDKTAKGQPLNFALLQGKDIVQNLKYLSISHNINLMYQLRDEYSLELILESARSEKNWKNLREYIRIFEEYSTYLTQKQKLQTIKFLYENLIHAEDDIRRHCAELIGTLIAIYDEDYRKEIPTNVKIAAPSISSEDLLKEYIDLLLFPGHQIIPTHRFWMGYSLCYMIDSLFTHCRSNAILSYRRILMGYYNETNGRNTDTALFLLETSRFIPLNPYEDCIEALFKFVILMMKKRSSILRISSLEIALQLLPIIDYESLLKFELINLISSSITRSSQVVENLLKLKLCSLFELKDAYLKYYDFVEKDSEKIPEIFLSNLKTATDWIKKKGQVELLLQYALESPTVNGMHTVIHFCNLLKVSAVESVRNKAGEAILKIVPYLSPAERNEVAVELLRALEIEGNRFTQYIPQYLGEIILWLETKELDEIIDDLKIKIKSSKPVVKSLILKTVGIAISKYSLLTEQYSEEEDKTLERLNRLLGILLNGLGDYDYSVKQSSFSVLGKDIFGSSDVTLSQKAYIFKLTAKKILTLITDIKNEELLFLSNSAGLKHIYRFISDYAFLLGEIKIDVPQKVAFFPGTFDPFSLSHKEIAKSIRDKGYEVYLAIDEFSWSKKTLPNLLRKSILNMSISDEFKMYVYPDNFPTSLSNQKDLETLRDNFPDSKVYMVVGSDVVMNASSYAKAAAENSIHNFPHIIFERNKSKKLEESSKKIKGEILWLTLPPKFSSISSTQIRNYIDDNRDISSLVDPMAEEYIYKNGFYQSEPQEKGQIKSLWLKVEVIENFSNKILNEVSSCIESKKDLIRNKLIELSKKQSSRIILLRDESNDNKIIGFSAFHWIRSSTLYEEFKDTFICEYIRNKSLGRIVLIDSLFAGECKKLKSLENALITETLAFCISHDYEYAIFSQGMPELTSAPIEEALKLQGFKLISSRDKHNAYVVDMSKPIVINMDLDNIIKEPFRGNSKLVQETISTRKKMLEALTKLYPGECILCFDSNVMHQHMIRKICKENSVSTEFVSPRTLGDAMCVPYGDILDRDVIPNTITKSLHTEKYFNPDMNTFKVTEFPHYLDLENQIKMLKSFNKPVILVDNLLHKGYRMRALDPLLKKENIKIKKIITGILSGKGKDLMDVQNREVTCVYFIPRIRFWLNENAMYPFIGGDSIWRGSFPERNLLPSVNLILPYTYPTFIRDTDLSTIFNLSKTCIKNSLAILTVLENEYHNLYERNLSIANMGQVFTIPRCPDKGKDMQFDLNLSPSHYLMNDLELLLRYGVMMKNLESRGN